MFAVSALAYCATECSLFVFAVAENIVVGSVFILLTEKISELAHLCLKNIPEKFDNSRLSVCLTSLFNYAISIISTKMLFQIVGYSLTVSQIAVFLIIYIVAKTLWNYSFPKSHNEEDDPYFIIKDINV